ncbi:MAG: hypothetical protein K2Y39_18010 [Candidatus Obscuribacterales bacterium]|nr:hypothetical protein [Candidatus Obscuribacterales bacterium]
MRGSQTTRGGISFCICAFMLFQLGCSAENASQRGSGSSQTKVDKRGKVSVVYAKRDVPDGFSVSAEHLEEWKVDASKIEKGRTPLHSVSQAVGRVAKNGLSSGQLIYQGDLTLPSLPHPNERWLFSYPVSILAKHAGAVVTVKGRWLTGDEKGFAILDYNGTGRIHLDGQPQPKMKEFGEGECIIATGRLLVSKKNGIPHYFFDSRSVVVTKSRW